MKTIYSILYVNLNTTLDERVSAGIFVSNGLKHYFKYSSKKLSAFKNILDSERYDLVKSYLKSIEKEIGFNESNISNQLFENKDFHNNWVSESYLSYLSKYSNNIVQFSSPKTIDVELKEETFRKIFEKYIFRYTAEVNNLPSHNIHEIVKNQLFPRIENRVNLELTLTSDDFKNLFAPIDIDFIGLNGIPVAGLTIDFEKKKHC
jgi:hypothetical protein